MGTVSLLYSFHGRLHMQSLTFSLRGPCSISCLDVYSMGNSSAGLKVSDVSSSSFSCQPSPTQVLGGERPEPASYRCRGSESIGIGPYLFIVPIGLNLVETI